MFEIVINQAKENLALKKIPETEVRFSELPIPVLYGKFIWNASRGIRLIKRVIGK